LSELSENTARPEKPAPGKGTAALLRGFFWAVLLLPKLRRQRRRPEWRRVQFAAAGVALIVIACGAGFSKPWLMVPGCLLLLFSIAVRRLRDPDHERKLQARYGASYLLNGGKLIAGRLPRDQALAVSEPLYLLLRDEELLFVPVGTEELAATLPISRIGDIRVGGEHYVPVYVSEAKDPPVREERVNQNQTTVTELVLDDGEVVKLAYTGAFHKHLAETAAHAIYSVRNLMRADGVGGQSPEVFHIVGR
jgi:hypothetical protein